MKLGIFTTIIALAAVGCVAQVGQPDDNKTGTVRTSLGDGLNSGGGDQGGGGGGSGGNNGGDPGDPGDPGNTGGDRSTPTSGDNQGPQPLPWDTSNASPSGGTQNKK